MIALVNVTRELMSVMGAPGRVLLFLVLGCGCIYIGTGMQWTWDVSWPYILYISIL